MKKQNVNNYGVLENLCGAEKTDALLSYLSEILKINEKINLTSITDFQKACLLHLEDSLVALPEVTSAIEGSYCDMGCGGGFPGVVLGVASERETWLVDSREKKVKAVKSCIEGSRASKFSKFICRGERIEDFSIAHTSQFAVVSARALSSLPSLLELASPLLKVGGTFVALKSQIDSGEEEQGLNVAPKLGFELETKRLLALSDGETNRSIYSFVKTKNSNIKLPRRVGLAQKKPLTN